MYIVLNRDGLLLLRIPVNPVHTSVAVAMDLHTIVVDVFGSILISIAGPLYLLSVFNMRNFSLIKCFSSLTVMLWLSTIVDLTRTSTFGFNDSEASIAVRSSGMQGTFHDSTAGDQSR